MRRSSSPHLKGLPLEAPLSGPYFRFIPPEGEPQSLLGCGGGESGFQRGAVSRELCPGAGLGETEQGFVPDLEVPELAVTDRLSHDEIPWEIHVVACDRSGRCKNL